MARTSREWADTPLLRALSQPLRLLAKDTAAARADALIFRFARIVTASTKELVHASAASASANANAVRNIVIDFAFFL